MFINAFLAHTFIYVCVYFMQRSSTVGLRPPRDGVKVLQRRLILRYFLLCYILVKSTKIELKSILINTYKYSIKRANILCPTALGRGTL